MQRDLVRTTWRLLVLCVLMFWQGGFFFYVAAVVPTAQEEIGHKRQGLITRKVTIWLNNAALLSLAMLAADAALEPDPRPWRRRRIWATWLAMVACQIALAALHPQMDARIAVERQGDTVRVAVDDVFETMHRIYLWTHTVQWLLAVAYLWMSIATWRWRDRTAALREV